MTLKRKMIKENPRRYDHYPIRDSREFDEDSFRTITLNAKRNIKGIIACREGFWDSRKNRCRRGTELQTVLYPLGLKPSSKNILIENPTKEQIQRVADFYDCPVAIPKDLRKELEMYETFHHQKPDKIVKAHHPETPGSLIALGKLESVIYKKYSDGNSYIHDLKHGILAADRKGKLFIIGDKAKITERGIVG